MKVPGLLQLELDRHDPVDMEEKIQAADVGMRPVYIQAEELSESELERFLTVLLKILQTCNIDPHFPYPCYIVSDKIHRHTHFPILKSTPLLPGHFKVRAKKVNHQEQVLQHKAKILAEKIHHRPLLEHRQDVKKEFASRRELYQLCRETQFYQEIYRGLHDK